MIKKETENLNIKYIYIQPTNMRYSASSPNLPGYVNNNRFIGRGRKNNPFEEKVNRSKVLQRSVRVNI